jgi:hypothetical protein
MGVENVVLENNRAEVTALDLMERKTDYSRPIKEGRV